MVLGRRPEPVAGATATQNAQNPPALDRKYGFGRPTDVTWDAQGNIFVSDGYVNSRVVKFDKNGRFIGQFAGGERGDGPNQLNTPHSISSDAQGNIYVGDRGNRRIVVLNNDLTLKTTYTNVGNPWAVCVSPGPHQYLYSSNSNPDSNPAASWAITGEIYKMELDGRIIGKFGKAGKGLGEFSTVHEIDCRNPDQLYRLGDLRMARAENHSQSIEDATGDVLCGGALRGAHEENTDFLDCGGARRQRRPPLGADGADDSVRLESEPVDDAREHSSWRGRGRGDELEGRYLRLHAHGQSDDYDRHGARGVARRRPPLPVRSHRQVRA